MVGTQPEWQPEAVDDMERGDELRLTMDVEVVRLSGPPVHAEERVVVELPDGRQLSIDPDDPNFVTQ